MHGSRRRLLLPIISFLVVGLMAGCGPGKPGNGDGGTNTDGGSDGGTGACTLGQANCCLSNHDCTALDTQYPTYTAYCQKGAGGTAGACELLCNVDSDCAKSEFSPSTCAGGACVCDNGFCKIPACSSDADCNGTGQCIGGKCTTGTASVDGCVIAPAPVYTHAGDTVQLHAYATKSGQYVVPSGTFSWASDNTSAATVDASTGLVTGGSTGGSAHISATIDGQTCQILDTNYAAAAAGKVRVFVFDASSRAPIVGARVVISSGANETDAATDNTGMVKLTAPSGSTYDVSVFTAPDIDTTNAPNGYKYVTIMGTTKNDLIVYLPRNTDSANPAPGMSGGYSGSLTPDDFAKLGSDEVHMALAGTSIPGNFMDIDLSVLIGELIQTHITFAGVNKDVPLPSGMVIGIGSGSSAMFKSDYDPLGLPGLRTAWALGGNLPLATVTQVLAPVLSGGGSNIPIGQLVGQLLPLLGQNFYSSVTPGVTISQYPRITDPNNSNKTIPDFSKFPAQALNFDTALGLKAIIDVPKLPKVTPAGGGTPTYLDGAVILGGTRVVGQGLVPLGVTAGTDVSDPQTDVPNGIVNDTGSNPNAGKLTLRLAPEHGGIEGSNYVILSIALGFSNLTGGGPTAISGYSKEVSSIGYQQEISFGATDYMPFATGATLNSSTRVYTPAAVTGADFYRLDMTDSTDQGWIVYHGSASGAITLPDPTAYQCGGSACADRLQPGEKADAQAVMTADGSGLDNLAAFNSQNLDSLGVLVKGFSNLGITAQ